ITKYKQNLMALDIAAEEWKTTFDAIPNAVFLLDRECRVVKCNRAAEKLLRRKKSGLIGRQYREIISKRGGPPEACPCVKMLKSGRCTREICSFNDRIVEITVSPVSSPTGEIHGSVILFTDITRLKNAEEQLKHKNKQLQSIFHTAPIGICVISGRTFVQANEQMCEITGYSCKELIGKTPRMLHDCDAEYNRISDIVRSARGNEIAVVRTEITRKDGRKVDVLLHFSALNLKTDTFTFTVTDTSKNK
ncbi:MAG: PAS domain-containing protein, partial [Victivallaceae bacterium]|nr:PAS domain-containing protein [Victivallaceae bacterium]